MNRENLTCFHGWQPKLWFLESKFYRRVVFSLILVFTGENIFSYTFHYAPLLLITNSSHCPNKRPPVIFKHMPIPSSLTPSLTTCCAFHHIRTHNSLAYLSSLDGKHSEITLSTWWALERLQDEYRTYPNKPARTTDSHCRVSQMRTGIQDTEISIAITLVSYLGSPPVISCLYYKNEGNVFVNPF